ncbi:MULTISPECIES: flagella synthesis protein FlgN [Microbulbifer]|uniref:Flagella synthesis protein FlgN n=1 Tax=Microbulbifer celer TaxID=435905 RepID=A0ABW3U4R2_9GAMM|nr:MULTISPECIES: flagellar protein FlgN [Microbulbifer]UFN57817.1 flagellar protein FlgN [Microbulbifer celer]
MSPEALLQQHLHLLETLHGQLLEERQQVSRGKLDGAELANIAHRKQQCVADINRLEQQRRQLLTRMGYANNRSGDEQAARDGGYAGQWRALLTLAAETAAMNTSNGEMIRLRTEHNQRLLNALQEAAGKNLYGPDGRASGRATKVDARA